MALSWGVRMRATHSSLPVWDWTSCSLMGTQWQSPRHLDLGTVPAAASCPSLSWGKPHVKTQPFQCPRSELILKGAPLPPPPPPPAYSCGHHLSADNQPIVMGGCLPSLQCYFPIAVDFPPCSTILQTINQNKCIVRFL